MMPPVADLLAGFIPSVPDPVAGDNSTPFLIISGMVGTTVAPAMFLMRTTTVKSNGWGVDNLPHQNRDAIVSAGMMFIISAAVMAAAAGTLYQTGTGLNNASQMVIILEPIAGSAAVGLFVIGIVAAGLSSQFPNLLLTPRCWLTGVIPATKLAQLPYPDDGYVSALSGCAAVPRTPGIGDDCQPGL